MRIDRSITIRRAVNDVFAFLEDVRNIPLWAFGVVESKPIDSEVPCLGMQYRITSQLLGKRLVRTFEITEFARNRTIAFKSIAGEEVPTAGSYSLSGDGETTLLVHESESDPGDTYEVKQVALERVIERQIEANLANLRDLLEEG